MAIEKTHASVGALFDSESFKNVRNKFEEILNKIKEYSKVIQLIIYDSFM